MSQAIHPVAGVLVRRRSTRSAIRPLSDLIKEATCPVCLLLAPVTAIGPSSAPRSHPYVVVEMLCRRCDKYRIVFYESHESTAVLQSKAKDAINLSGEPDTFRESFLDHTPITAHDSA